MVNDRYELLEAEHVDYQSPLSVTLRRWMKERLFEAIKRHPNPLKDTYFDGGSLVIYGTTLMTVATLDGTSFPYAGKKAGDIDLYIEPPAGKKIRSPREFTEQYKKVMGPFMKHVMAECDFKIIRDKWHNGHNAGDLVFAKPFGVAKHFTPQEIAAIAAKTGSTIEVPREGADISLEIDLVASPPLSLLSPKESSSFAGSLTPIKTDDWKHLLAKKLIRASQPEQRNLPVFQHSTDPNGFKPRDIVDIYNILHAQPPLLNLNPKDPGNDLEILRILCLTYAARFDKQNLSFNLTHYNPTEQNIDSFKKSLTGRIAMEHPLTDHLIPEFFKAYAGLLHQIFPEMDKSYAETEVPLRPKEQDFLTEIRGYRVLPSGGYQQVEPAINTTLLKNIYPNAFTRYPELDERLHRHPTLNETVNKIEDTRNMSL